MHSLYSSLLMIILTLLIFVGFPKRKLKFNKLLLLFILTDKLNPNEEVFLFIFPWHVVTTDIYLWTELLLRQNKFLKVWLKGRTCSMHSSACNSSSISTQSIPSDQLAWKLFIHSFLPKVCALLLKDSFKDFQVGYRLGF